MNSLINNIKKDMNIYIDAGMNLEDRKYINNSIPFFFHYIK